MRDVFGPFTRPGPARAVLLILASTLLYTLGYAMTKTLLGRWHYGAVQLFVLRSLLVLGPLLIWGAIRHDQRFAPSRLLSPPRPWAQRSAALALVASSLLAVLGYGLLPMTMASAFGFTAPMMITALSGVVLKERVSWLRWAAVALGFLGMLLVVRPHGGAGLHWLGIFGALGAAVTYAVYQILIRRLRDTATTADAVGQASFIGVLLLGLPAILVWRDLSPAAWLLIIGATAAQTAGLATIAAAIREGQVSQLAPWQYSGLLWALLMDALLFHHLPDGLALVGVAVIVGAGLLGQVKRRRS
jgi:drug/metabolite transporter (DMT)-like permease